MKTPMVAVVAFNGISLFHLSVPCLVFGEDRTNLGLPRFELRVCAIDRARHLASRSGPGLVASDGLERLAGADIVIVPSWRGADVAVPAPLSQAVADAHGAGALIVGLCLGSFVLAAAGILSGRKATTHWAATGQLAARYPDIRVEPDVLYVDEGSVVTSAGVAASLDCCLHVIRRLYGAAPAQRLARQIVLPPHREGGQAQFIEKPVPVVASDARLSNIARKVLADPSLPYTLDMVAGLAGLSRRTFTRRFRDQTGISFLQWLTEQRVSLARQLLETTTHPIEEVARLSGFGSSVSLRQHFRARLSTAPEAYRRTFAGSGDQGGSCASVAKESPPPGRGGVSGSTRRPR